MEMIAEALHTLLLEAFFAEDVQGKLYYELIQQQVKTEVGASDAKTAFRLLNESGSFSRVNERFTRFVTDKAERNRSVKFWAVFLFEMYPVLRDMTQSFRTGMIQTLSIVYFYSIELRQLR